MTLEDWIAPDHLDPNALGAKFRESSASPFDAVELPEFIRPERARAVCGAMQTIDYWQKTIAVSDSPIQLVAAGDLREVSEDEWQKTPVACRLSHHNVARPLEKLRTSDALRPLLAYVGFLASKQLRAWLAIVYGKAVELRSVEIASYDRGDSLYLHSDAYDGRVMNLVSYFDGDWKPGDGGEFLYINARHEERRIAPKLGAVALLPIVKSCLHGAAPFNRERGRWTVAASFKEAPAAT